jgi:predicted peptidase
MRRGRTARLHWALAVSALLGGCQLATPPAPDTSLTASPAGRPTGSATREAIASASAAVPTVGPGPTLTGLDIRVPANTGGPLTPAFSSERTRYAVTVDSDISALGVVPTVSTSDAVGITVGGNPVTSGESATVPVPVGRSEIAVAVAAADGSGANTYTLEVDRQDIGSVVEKFQRLTFSDPATGETMGYRLFVPDGYDATRSYPLVLFLHGAGERGTDNEVQLTANQGATVWATPEEQAKHPAFVLAPQSGGSPRTLGWTSLAKHGQNAPFDPQKELVTAYDILQHVKGEYHVDSRRLYVTGVSLGGFGAYAMAIAHPEEFAAVVPICGGGDPARLAAIAKIPIWIFHAAKDPTVRVGYSRNSVAALKRAGGHPRYTEYPADAYFYPSEHFSWTSAYATVEMRDWLFAQAG